MTILPKNRAYLRGLGTKIKPSLNLGKSEIDDSFIHALENALVAHELVKIRVLQNSEQSVHDLAEEMASKSNSGLVAITGNTILLFRQNEKNPVIKLPR